MDTSTWTIDEWQRNLCLWQSEQFPNATFDSVLAHLTDEIKTELHSGCDPTEYADCMFLLFGLAWKDDIQMKSVFEEQCVDYQDISIQTDSFAELFDPNTMIIYNSYDEFYYYLLKIIEEFSSPTRKNITYYDCCILLYQLACEDHVDLLKVMEEKFIINKNREWETELNEKGYYSHIKNS